MLLLKLSDACFLDSPENGYINHETCEFVLNYILHCASEVEMNAIHVENKPILKDKDLVKLPKVMVKELIRSAKRTQELMADAVARRRII